MNANEIGGQNTRSIIILIHDNKCISENSKTAKTSHIRPTYFSKLNQISVFKLPKLVVQDVGVECVAVMLRNRKWA